MSFRHFWLILPVCLGLAWHARADAPVPPSVLNPATAAEAWNVLHLAADNLGILLKEGRLGELTVQASLCSPALRTLEKFPPSPADAPRIQSEAAQAARQVVEIAVAAKAQNQQQAEAAYGGLTKTLAAMRAAYDPKVTGAEIYICPMHPDVISEAPAMACHRCGMRLVTRRIPYSFIYSVPGEPSVQLTASTDAPLEVGRKATVRIKLNTRDGKPVSAGDLLVTHTQPIHLLIVDPSLSDYHHEHPLPVNSLGEPMLPVRAIEGAMCGTARGVPGEFVFSFTPRLAGPYRIWADLVPAATGLQEYAFTDLAGQGAGGQLLQKGDALSSAVDGFSFQLTFMGYNRAAPRARQVRYLSITVADAAGQPVQRLEPLMNAFAHLVGFYDDNRTVVHFHPEGGEILREEARGGPALTFRIYPPKAGFMRLYCQVKIDGREVFAPFGVNVVE